MSRPVMSAPPHGLLLFGFRLPIWLYRLHLGWLLDDRFLLLNHVGRKSRLLHKTVIEVVNHNLETDSFYVVSGWGKKSDWYQNVQKNPEVTISVGNRRLSVHAFDVSISQAIDILETYSHRYPMAFKELTGMFLGERLEPGLEGSRRLAQMMPMIAFHPLNK